MQRNWAGVDMVVSTLNAVVCGDDVGRVSQAACRGVCVGVGGGRLLLLLLLLGFKVDALDHRAPVGAVLGEGVPGLVEVECAEALGDVGAVVELQLAGPRLLHPRGEEPAGEAVEVHPGDVAEPAHGATEDECLDRSEADALEERGGRDRVFSRGPEIDAAHGADATVVERAQRPFVAQ